MGAFNSSNAIVGFAWLGNKLYAVQVRPLDESLAAKASALVGLQALRSTKGPDPLSLKGVNGVLRGFSRSHARSLKA